MRPAALIERLEFAAPLKPWSATDACGSSPHQALDASQDARR